MKRDFRGSVRSLAVKLSCVVQSHSTSWVKIPNFQRIRMKCYIPLVIKHFRYPVLFKSNLIICTSFFRSLPTRCSWWLTSGTENWKSVFHVSISKACEIKSDAPSICLDKIWERVKILLPKYGSIPCMLFWSRLFNYWVHLR